MKICPNCESQFKRRKNKKCPECDIELVYVGNGKKRKLYLKEDIDFRNYVIEKVGNHLNELRGFYLVTPKDYVMVTNFVREVRQTAKQYTSDIFSLLEQLIEYAFNQKWFRDRIEDMGYFTYHSKKFLNELLSQIVKQKEKTQYEHNRKHDYIGREFNLDGSII